MKPSSMTQYTPNFVTFASMYQMTEVLSKCLGWSWSSNQDVQLSL